MAKCLISWAEYSTQRQETVATTSLTGMENCLLASLRKRVSVHLHVALAADMTAKFYMMQRTITIYVTLYLIHQTLQKYTGST